MKDNEILLHKFCFIEDMFGKKNLFCFSSDTEEAVLDENFVATHTFSEYLEQSENYLISFD
jgi:hypothetical protein